MKFSQFLLLFAVNFLTIALPNAVAVYAAIRWANRRSEK
jgi:hypothetical protein